MAQEAFECSWKVAQDVARDLGMRPSWSRFEGHHRWEFLPKGLEHAALLGLGFSVELHYVRGVVFAYHKHRLGDSPNEDTVFNRLLVDLREHGARMLESNDLRRHLNPAFDSLSADELIQAWAEEYPHT